MTRAGGPELVGVTSRTTNDWIFVRIRLKSSQFFRVWWIFHPGCSLKSLASLDENESRAVQFLNKRPCIILRGVVGPEKDRSRIVYGVSVDFGVMRERECGPKRGRFKILVGVPR